MSASGVLVRHCGRQRIAVLRCLPRSASQREETKMHRLQRLTLFFVVVFCTAPVLVAQVDAAFLANADITAYVDQNTQQQREPWNLGERQPNWTASSTLTIENLCKSRHQFEVVPQDLPFVQIQASTQSVPVGGHQTKQLPVKFDTTGIPEGEHVGQVVVRCLDCAKEPGCTQDKEFIPVRMVIAKNTSTTQPPTGSEPGQAPPITPPQGG